MNLRRLPIEVWALAVVLFLPNLISAQSSDLQGLQQTSDEFERLSQTVSPAVVQIITTGYLPGAPRAVAPGDLLDKRRSSGSGVILDPSGYIVTNAHVVDGAQRIQILLAKPPENIPEGRSILKPHGKLIGAQLIGLDRETDLAVLRVYQENLPHLTLGNSDRLNQGELVFAFGSPLGLENSVSMGVISSVARQLTPEDPMIYLQTDAPINPGNSGGPLVNTSGEVVGINTFIFSQSGGNEGIGFSAPSNIVKNVYNQIRDKGYVERGTIGIYTQTITPMLARGLDLARGWGAIIGGVHPEGPAYKAGVMAGDIILTLDGKIIENGRQFDVNLYQRSVGESISLKLLRGADTVITQVVVAERPENINHYLETVSPERNLVEKIGVLAIDFDEFIATMMPRVRVDRGVVVAASAPPTLSWDGGLKPGDVIFNMNGLEIESITDLRRAVEELSVGDPVVFHIDRAGRQMYIAFEIE